MNEENHINTIDNISYCGLKISSVNLPNNLSDFKKEFITKYGLTNQINSDDISSIKYNNQEIMDDSSYYKMLEEISKKNNISTIEVKTKKVPVHFKGEKSTDFEEKIKKLIENEFRVAANHIREGLTNHICLSNCKKVRNEICSNCKEQIFGYLFKKISAENNDKFYCELCSTEINEPMFKIY